MTFLFDKDSPAWNSDMDFNEMYLKYRIGYINDYIQAKHDMACYDVKDALACKVIYLDAEETHLYRRVEYAIDRIHINNGPAFLVTIHEEQS